MSDEYGRCVCGLAVAAHREGWTERKLVTTSLHWQPRPL